MTLRVRVSIVPFGDESKEREIEVLNISNIGPEGFDHYYCNYIIEHNAYKTGKKDLPTVVHCRPDGALELVRKAIQKLQELQEQ